MKSGASPSRADALATLRFAILNGVASSAHVHRMSSGPAADAMVEAILQSVLSPSTSWCLEILALPEEGGGR